MIMKKSLLSYMIDMFNKMVVIRSPSPLKVEELLSLPINILELILVQYLSINDLSSLDIAICNNSNRQRLLLLLADPCIIFKNVTLNKCNVDNAMVWFGLRKINIVKLSIIGNSSLTNKGLKGISLNCSLLESLYIGGVNSIDDDGIISLSNRSSRLKTLYIKECSHITDSGIIELANNCSLLSSLYIPGSSITDKSITRISEKLPNLLTLNISDCYHVTSKSILELGNNCLSIEQLYIGGCNINDDILDFVNMSNSLQVLNINGCNSISDDGVITLQKKNLVSLYVGRK